MKTTVDIPEHELRDAMRFTRAKTKREAVVKVLEEFNRHRRMAELVRYAGTFSDGYPSNDRIEAVDERWAARRRSRNDISSATAPAEKPLEAVRAVRSGEGSSGSPCAVAA